MSKVKIEGNASGTGTLTISAPNTDTDRSLTLPDGAGEILLSDGDGSNLTGVGKVLQVVQASYSTDTYTSSTSFTDTGLSGNITPSSTSSKVLILVNQMMYTNGQNSDRTVSHRIVRDSTAIASGNSRASIGSTLLNVPLVGIYSYLDSPSTTSQITYKTQFKTNNSTNSLVYAQYDSGTSTIIMIEVGA